MTSERERYVRRRAHQPSPTIGYLLLMAMGAAFTLMIWVLI